jgi:hypothetical protein
MNVLRSSPLRDSAEASVLHFFILSCWVIGAIRTSWPASSFLGHRGERAGTKVHLVRAWSPE